MFRIILTITFTSVAITASLTGLPHLVSGQSPQEQGVRELQREPETETLIQDFGEWLKKKDLKEKQAGDFADGLAAYDRGDFQTALKLFRNLGEQGEASSQYNLALMYETGQGGPQDFQQARVWYEKAALQGQADAQYNLALMYETGLGGPQDFQQARQWFERAVLQGHAGAQGGMGNLYLNGRGIPEDYAAALTWFRRAANQGHAFAQMKLGLMYRLGFGVPQDYVQAHMWWNLAVAAGDAQAANSRAEVAALMTPAQVAEAQKLAREWQPKK